MSKSPAFFILFLLIIFQSSCQTLKLDEQIKSADSLEVSLPENDFNLAFIQGYREIKQQHYYYESSRWINKRKNMDVYVAYTYLLDNYIFANDTTLEELIKESFEDRVISIGSEKVIIKKDEVEKPFENLVESATDESFRGFNQQSNATKKGKRDEVTSIAPFKLEGASCLFFRRYLHFSSEVYDYITGASSVFDAKGDAKITGYVCNYGQSSVTNEALENFITEIKAGMVNINPHLDELKKRNADAKS